MAYPPTMAATVTMDIPEEFVCPISYEIMQDPVIASDGQTYDRTSIVEWLKTRQISPLTNLPITTAGLVSNFALRAAIQRWMTTSGAAGAAITKPTSKNLAKPFTITVSKDSSTAWVSCDAEPMECIEILVLDVSGSMGGTAARTRSVEGGDYSRLDLVKHASRTVASMLAERNSQGTPCYLSIITYSNDAMSVLPLRQMTPANLDGALTSIDAICVEGATNIWDGLRLGLDTAIRAARMHPDASISIRLLTDGEPTDTLSPPVGIVNALKRKLATMMDVRLTISTFGFGYSLDTKLLREICETGGGTFGYIPDCSMVGTVFINACANSLSTVAKAVTVELKNGGVFEIGNLLAGQKYSIPFGDAGGAPMTVVVRYDANMEMSVTVSKGGDDATFEYTLASITSGLLGFLLSKASVAETIRYFQGIRDDLAKKNEVLKNPRIAALIDDISSADANKGQILKALSRTDWLTEWGMNHLIAYMRAIKCQQCVNFKDLAPQHFTTSMTRALCDMGNLIFNNLPAPKPSIPSYNSSGAAAPINMAIFNNAQGGCWAGYCKIRLADDTWCYASEIKPGYFVYGGHKVVCVVETEYEQPIRLCKFGGLSITPWHPIRNMNDREMRWYFPANLVSQGIGATNYEMVYKTYNLVLESGHSVEIDNYKVCTLGHHMEGNVIGHPYFGTYRVIEDLKRQNGWGWGIITLSPNQWVRDENGLVCGLRNGRG